MHLLSIQNLYRSFEDPITGLLKPVLENVDLNVSPGEFVTLLGPSGCGKSTLLNILLGADQGYEGEVLIGNKPVGFTDKTRGYVQQRYSLYPHLTVFGNVKVGLDLQYSLYERIIKRKSIREEVMVYLEAVGLVEHANKFPYQLSGGQQQRVAIAQTLVTQPGIVFMDEPFGALDPSTRERVQVFLLELWEKQKMTVFFVTHDIGEALFLGTRLVLLSQYYTDDRGEIDSLGNPVMRGSKIVRDLSLSKLALSTKTKGSPEFVACVRDIAEGTGFRPQDRRHVRQFDLLHSDSFQTLTSVEDANLKSVV